MSDIQELSKKFRNKDIDLMEFQLKLAKLILGMTEATAEVIAIRMLISPRTDT